MKRGRTRKVVIIALIGGLSLLLACALVWCGNRLACIGGEGAVEVAGAAEAAGVAGAGPAADSAAGETDVRVQRDGGGESP